MATNPADARAELWRRYDAGEATAEEVEARLVLLDRAGDDEASVRSALDGSIPLHRRRAARRTAVVAAGALAVVLLGAGAAAVVGGDGGGDSGSAGDEGVQIFAGGGFAVDRVAPAIGFAEVATTVVGVAVAEADASPDPLPIPTPECLEGEERLLAGEDVAPANPGLLSDPPFAPEAYAHGYDGHIDPGDDPDFAMSVAAGNPLPVEIAGRELDGPLPVRMRAFRHADAAQATDAAAATASLACGYDIPSFFEVPDRPEIIGFVVTGIPTTAFATWQLGDRRFIVAVEPNTDDDGAVDESDLAAARLLAGEIAGAELDAARTAAAAG